MGVATLIAQGVGGALNVVNNQAQANAQKAQSRYQQQVAQNNRLLAERAARDAVARGQELENRQRSATQQAIGASRASAAARGVEVDTGSQLEQQVDIAEIGEVEALTVRDNARREEFALRQQASDFDQEAQFASAQRSQINKQLPLNIAGSLLNTGSQVASQWYAFRQTGAV